MKKDFNPKRFNREIFNYMLKTRGLKYKWFLMGLKSYKLFGGKTRGNFLESYYALMRYVDDVVDKDAPLPFGFNSSVDFVNSKISFVETLGEPKDNIDNLILYCFDLASRMNLDFREETLDILNSMLFDAKRIGRKKIFLESDLNSHFYLLDIRGTVRATLKIYGENPDSFENLIPLSVGVRKFYNLRDFKEDIQTGLVNISIEDCKKFGINTLNLEDIVNISKIDSWIENQAEQGLELLDEHRRIIRDSKFGIKARLTFPLVYEGPARRYFEKILNI